jgi:CYTH domain-containing protein/8-oxo-dGTP pyrophosphatase MutT (NUDIX family)
MEIERKFLVNEIPGSVKIGSGIPILQGYLYAGENTEVRVRRAGKKHILTSKNGKGLQREENEVSITPKQFELLWPASMGRRLNKERHIVRLENSLRAELDIYQDLLSGLQLVEVEFNDLDQAKQFKRPAWFGPEVTDDTRFANRNLARCGPDDFPDDLRNVMEEKRRSVGAIPVIKLNGINRFVVITTRNKMRWIYPKGNPEDGVVDEKVAIQEALEEAGVKGELFGPSVPVHYWKGYIHYIIDYYPMQVSTLYTDWIEKNKRERRVCTLEEAVELLNDPGFTQATQRLMNELPTP